MITDPISDMLTRIRNAQAVKKAALALPYSNIKFAIAKILEKDSKHLQAASYLNYGLIKTKGLEGLYQGIHILKELIENFWETLFPPKNRMKGRKGIIVWWEEKISDFVSNADPVTWKKEKRDALIDELTYIDTFLGENMEDAPLLLPLIKRVKEAILEEKEGEAREG